MSNQTNSRTNKKSYIQINNPFFNLAERDVFEFGGSLEEETEKL